MIGNKLTVIDEFTPDKIDLIKRTVAVGATDVELELFLYQAKRTGLDPLARQIHFSKFKNQNGPDRVSIITSIDGYRLLAERTGKYAGNDDPEHLGEVKGKYNSDNYTAPERSAVTVWKIVAGVRCPFTATARWSEYYPGDNNKGFMWRKMPYLMLGKCAEALALRKAFPAELSGLYTDTEMDQAQGEIIDIQPEVRPARQEPLKTNGQAKRQPTGSQNPDTFFAQVQQATGDYYDAKEHLYNTLKRWPKFSDPDDVEAALSEAVDHTRQKAEPAVAEEKDEVPF